MHLLHRTHEQLQPLVVLWDFAGWLLLVLMVLLMLLMMLLLLECGVLGRAIEFKE